MEEHLSEIDFAFSMFHGQCLCMKKEEEKFTVKIILNTSKLVLLEVKLLAPFNKSTTPLDILDSVCSRMIRCVTLLQLAC